MINNKNNKIFRLYKRWEAAQSRIVAVQVIGETNKVLSIDSRNNVKIWDFVNGPETSISYKVPVPVAARPDGKLLASKGEKSSIEFYDIQLNEISSIIKKPDKIDGEITLLRFSPDGKTLVSGYSKQVCFWKLYDNKENYTFVKTINLNEYLTAISFSTSGNKVAVAYGSTNLHIFDNNAELILSTKNRKYTAWNIDFSADDKMFATSEFLQDQNIVRIYHTETGELKKQIRSLRPDLGAYIKLA